MLQNVVIRRSEPRDIRVEVSGVVRADHRPCHCEAGNSSPKIENLGCSGRRCRWGVRKVLATDAYCDEEDQEDGDPNCSREPAKALARYPG